MMNRPVFACAQVRVALFALLFAVAITSPAHAAVTHVAYWRLGENDPGATNGGTATSTTNLVGGALNLVPNASYTNDIAANAASRVGSTLGLRFNSGNFGTNALVANLTNNFGFELWVRPESASGTQCLGYNGSSASSGWGLYLIGGQFRALFGGVGSFPAAGAPATANVWAHVALVRDNGTNVVYLNGAPVITNSVNPNLPAGRFALAAQAQSLTTEFFAGSLDEVRVFSFAPGAFNPNDLLYFNGQPPVVTTAAAASVGATNATLNGSVNPGNLVTAAWFEWGTTTNYGNVTATNSLVATNVTLVVSNSLTGLAGGVTYHYRAAASNALGVSYGTNVSFTTLPFALVTSFPGGYAFAPGTWGDYDGDGRLDLCLSTYSFSSPVRPIWRNTVNGFTNLDFVTIPSPGQEGNSHGAWADYDNDGRLDFMEAEAASGLPKTRLWRNSGSTFTNVTATLLASLSNAPSAVIAWGDFNNDGRPDFIRTGAGVTEIWRNTAAGFSNVTASLAPGLPQLLASHAAWADFDNDGRLDFILTGSSGGTNYSQLWRNTGTGFSNVTATVAPGLPGVRASGRTGFETRLNTAWGDYDNDGWLDLLIEGNPNLLDAGPFITQLWRNNGGTFTNVPVPGLPASSAASVAWGDQDNDGRLDILILGATNFVAVAQVWRNTGSGFALVPTPGLTPSGISSGLAWGDYDNDGRLDILFSRENDAQLWRNHTPVANTPPGAPTGLTATATTDGVVFSWSAAPDAQTPPAGLNYNVRAGTTPGGQDLISGNVNATTGFRFVPALGNAQMNLSLRLTLEQVPLGQKIYWSVQAIDGAWAGGAFATENVFTHGFALVSVPGLPAGSRAAWGDHDNDGLLDVFLTGGSGVAQLWRNTGSTFTNVPIAGLSGLLESAVAWGDFDNDARLDFLLTGSPDGLEETAVSQLWRNTGSGFTNVTATRFSGLPGFIGASPAWGDYDNDGRLDLAVGGSYFNGLDSTIASQLWRNTGSNFVNVSNLLPGLPAIVNGTFAWADYDRDGWLDLFLAGAGETRLYRNTGSGFTNVTATALPGVPGLGAATAAWGDYDNDGRPDLLLLGAVSNNVAQPTTQLWRNTGGAFTNVPVAGLPAVFNGSVQWGDYDADGRLDFLVNGTFASGIGSTNQLWRNTGTGFVPVPFTGLSPLGYGQSAWADFDNDGKLDFLTTGNSGAQLWRNDTALTNTPPTAPAGLLMTRTATAALLSWSAASDAQTPSSGLSYNVRAGTTPGGTNLLTAHVDASTGFRRLPARGNAEQRQFLPLLGLTNGQTVYWSVQAVDTAFAGGPFASETSVVTIPQLNILPNTATNALLLWTPPTFGWVLQTSPDLAPVAWSNAPSGALNPVLVPLTNEQKTFFQLIQQ